MPAGVPSVHGRPHSQFQRRHDRLTANEYRAAPDATFCGWRNVARDRGRDMTVYVSLQLLVALRP